MQIKFDVKLVRFYAMCAASAWSKQCILVHFVFASTLRCLLPDWQYKQNKTKNSATHYKRFCNFLSKNNSNNGLYSGQLWECFRFRLLNSEVRSGRKLVIDWQNTCVKIAEFTELLDDFWSDLQKVIRNHHRRQQNWCYYEAVRPKKPLPVKALQMAH